MLGARIALRAGAFSRARLGVVRVPQADSDLNYLCSETINVVEPWRYAVPTQNNMAHHLRSPCQCWWGLCCGVSGFRYSKAGGLPIAPQHSTLPVVVTPQVCPPPALT
jgi:hypothetical protein